jgi:signal transduction histidine kinase/DNA-binding response OmpR family regulator/predicted negative regulator of RcsB-dependent stress response
MIISFKSNPINRLLLLCLLLLPAGLSVRAQERTIDSLVTQLNLSRPDTGRVHVLNALTLAYRNSEPDKAMQYAGQARKLADSLGFDRGQARALDNMGWVHYRRGELDKALSLSMQALRLSHKAKDTWESVNASINIASVYYEQENYAQAIAYFTQAFRMSEKLGDKLLQGRALNNLAFMYLKQGKYPLSLEYSFKALRNNEQTNDKYLISFSLRTIGDVYAKQADYAKALKYQRQALEAAREVGNKYMIVTALNRMGDVYTQLGDYGASLSSQRQALAISLEAGLRPDRVNIYRGMADAYVKTGDFRNAYHYQQLGLALNDSIFKERNSRQIAEMQARYENGRKEQENQLLRQENALKAAVIDNQSLERRWIYTGLAFVGLLIGLAYVTNRRVANRNLLIQRQEAQMMEERLQNDLRLERLESEKLAELNNLKSHFFANISHEFRTPLTLILAPLEKMMASPTFSTSHDHELKVMHRNTQRLLQLINQLLDLSRLESGSVKLEVSRGDLGRFVRVMAGSLSSLAESRGIDLALHLDTETPPSYFDKDKVEKVLYNLLSNALKFTGAGGKVTVSLDRVSDTAVHGGAAGQGEAGEYVRISVQDTGKGIPQDQLTKIFDRFYQIDGSATREQEGSGIGLSLVKELVSLHRGTLHVESRPGEGACFTVHLPLFLSCPAESKLLEVAEPQPVPVRTITAGQPEAPATETARAETAKKPAKPVEADGLPLLLIVEDNDEIRTYIREIFAGSYTVAEAANGQDGLTQAIATVPDVIISDLMMPLMDGVELCTRLRQDQRTSHIPLILLTAKASVESRISGFQTGADDYVTKPFHPVELLARVKNLVESRRQLRERFSREVKLQPKDITVASVDELFLQKVLAVVEENLGEAEFSVENLESQMSMSKMQLYRKLKALTGQSPSEFMRNLRLKRAASLISQRSGNISEIAYSVGFNNLSYFAKCFKELYQVTPSEYAAQPRDTVV